MHMTETVGTGGVLIRNVYCMYRRMHVHVYYTVHAVVFTSMSLAETLHWPRLGSSDSSMSRQPTPSVVYRYIILHNGSEGNTYMAYKPSP